MDVLERYARALERRMLPIDRQRRGLEAAGARPGGTLATSAVVLSRPVNGETMTTFCVDISRVDDPHAEVR